MLSFLEVILTFVSAILVLSLAAQSVQEILKTMIAVKGRTMLHGMRGLLTESARSIGLTQTDAGELLQAVIKRLQGLGQNGVRPNALRLDTLTADQLAELVTKVDKDAIPGLKSLSQEVACTRLQAIAEQSKKWFALSMDPVDDRYRRRMRVYALVSSAIVVLGLNASALDVLHRARTDPTFRSTVTKAAMRADSVLRLEAARCGSSTAGAPSTSADSAACASVRAARDTTMVAVGALQADTNLLFGPIGQFRVRDTNWWVGIVASILLVSLGAPFWHDLLESLFGLKNKIAAEAVELKSGTQPKEKTSGS